MKRQRSLILMILLVGLLFSTDAFTQTPTVRITPRSIESPGVGGQFSVDVMIEDGQGVTACQFAVSFDEHVLTYLRSTRGDYLPRSGKNPLFRDVELASGFGRFIFIQSTSGGLPEADGALQEADGDGTLATLTFRVNIAQVSQLTLNPRHIPDGHDLLIVQKGIGVTPRVVDREVDIQEGPAVATPVIKIPEQDDIISKVAFGPNSTYFVLTAQFPEVIFGFTADVNYRECTITLHPSEGTQIFVLPIEPPEQQHSDAYTAAKFGVAVAEEGLDKAPVVSTALDIAETLTAFANYLQALEEKRNPLVQIKLSPQKDRIFPTGDQRYPPDILEFVVILKNEDSGSRSNLEFTIEQKYWQGNTGGTATARGNWNLSSAAPAAPAVQPMSLADYPAFQLLPPEVQEYLLPHVGAFATPEVWHIPEMTSLSPNYPNPFNPETWIPYRLAKPSDVEITIYDARGRSVRHLQLGHQPAGYYTDRSRAAHWDGRNAVGEPVASGLYFYTLTVGDFSATRKMLIRK